MPENTLEWNNCPEWVVALLEKLDKELRRVMWNVNQKVYDSPFSNSGNMYEGDCFKVRSYDWDGDKDINFEWKDMKFRWYKYLGRDTEVNGNWEAEKYIEMFNECLESICNIDKEIWEEIEQWEQ